MSIPPDRHQADWFLDEIVLPTVKGFLNEPSNIRLAMLATVVVASLADYIFEERPALRSGTARSGQFREKLANQSQHYSFIRDVGDASKHMKLDRKSAKFTDIEGIASKSDFLTGEDGARLLSEDGAELITEGRVVALMPNGGAEKDVEPAIREVIGVLGIDFLIFGLVFNTITLVERSSRPSYVITLFSIFSVVTVAILGMAIYLLIATSKVALLPVPPISVGETGSVIPLPASELAQTPHPANQFDANALQSAEGKTEIEFFEMGWNEGYPPHPKDKPLYVTFKAGSGINFQVGGFVWDQGALGRFSVVVSSGGPYTVEKIFVKLHKFAECPLRNEHYEQLAPEAFPGYAFNVSKDVNLYEIVPRTALGAIGNWQLNDGEYDEFQIRFVYQPYVLFIVSIEADAVRRSNGDKVHIATPLLPLLRVSHGNVGGCLKLSDWYSIDLLRNPQQRSYSSLVGDLALYQILSADGLLDRNFLKSVVDKTPPDQVRDMLTRLSNIANRNRENTIFAENISWLQKLLNWKATDPTTDPP